MDRRGASMDEGQDVWDWEVLPDHMSSPVRHDSTKLSDDQGTKEPIIMPQSSDANVHDDEEPVKECKDIGVVLEETEPSKEEEAMPEVTDDPPASDGAEEEEEALQSPDVKSAEEEELDDEEEEEEDGIKKKQDDGGARPECVAFSVGKLKVNGIGALCSFGVAAATVCIFLIGGKVQHHHRQQQQHKIQLQFYGDDKRIQQVVQQTSRLNQAMSSVMGGGGGSTRANISFGGYYDGF